MAQLTSGLYSIFNSAKLYGLFQKMVGSSQGRRWYIDAYFRLTPGIRILDIGCGPAKVLDCLPSDVEYIGYDVSESYIRDAKRKFGSRGTFYSMPIEEMRSIDLPRVDLVTAIGVLHHLDDQQAKTVFEIAVAHLKKGGHLFTLDATFAKGQSLLSRIVVGLDRGRNIRSPEAYTALAAPYFQQV